MIYARSDCDNGLWEKAQIIKLDDTVFAMLLTLMADKSDEGIDTLQELREDLEETCDHYIFFQWPVSGVIRDLQTKNSYSEIGEGAYCAVAVAPTVQQAKAALRKEIKQNTFEEGW